MNEPPHPVLAWEKVRHVGDQVALVVAETYLQAKDAAELVEVDYEELPAVIDITEAASSSTLVHASEWSGVSMKPSSETLRR